MFGVTTSVEMTAGRKPWHTPVVIEASVIWDTEQFKGTPGPDITTEVGSAGS